MSSGFALHFLIGQLRPGASRHENMIGLAVLDWNVRRLIGGGEVLLITGGVSDVIITECSAEADWGQEGLRLLVKGFYLEVAHHGGQLVGATNGLAASNHPLRFDKRVVVRTIVSRRH